MTGFIVIPVLVCVQAVVDRYFEGRKHALCNAGASAAQHSIGCRRIQPVGKIGGFPHAMQGLCSNAHCGYLHVKLEPGVRACQAFLRGFCAAGASCPRLHVTPRMLRDLRASRSLVAPAAAVQVHCRSTAALSASAEFAHDANYLSEPLCPALVSERDCNGEVV